MNCEYCNRVREPNCRECANWFLGCLNGREKWSDKAITPNYRTVELSDGSKHMLCDAFILNPNPCAQGRVVFDDCEKRQLTHSTE